MYELRGELASGGDAKRLIRAALCPILLPNENSAEVRAMKQWTWLALAGLLTTLSCGSEETVQPTPDYADAWVGEYEGTGNFALSNGISGEDRPVTISIMRVSPKQVTVSATLVYGEGRDDFFQEIDILQPDDPGQITLEVRYLNAKTVYAFAKEEDTITGSIATSSLRLGGTWGQDQIMTAIEAVRQ